ncbi:site-specific integrase [Hydrogenovibrio sp. JE_KL2]|uniref:site-specific integrase n=1 Tax=Hydrogenovibrio sp. JE_KL2 TaxID=2651188 RepID=UPI00128D6B5C|nr:site-specific integrase [Hydrogenovibrio sp. JE_KL2]MPQ77438.1 tyrosine-type recombinase/integrase [Hydrogenovibrio sp. JE_KL2]
MDAQKLIGSQGDAESFEKVFSTYGYEFYEGDTVWRLSRDNSINLESVLSNLDDGYKYGFIKTLSFICQTRSAGYGSSINSSFALFLKLTNAKTINSNTLINFRSGLKKVNVHRLGTMRTFLKLWHDLGYEGIDESLIDMLYSWRIPGSIKGDVVKRLDPYDGPLTDIELSAFSEGLALVYERSDIDLFSYSMIKVLLATGRRPKQIAELKLMDIQNEGNKFFLNIPRAKQRAAGFRTTFKRFAITPELNHIVLLHKEDVIIKVEKTLGFRLPDGLKLKLPLFPKFSVIEESSSTLQQVADLLDTDRVHLKTADIDLIFKSVSKVVNVFSERTSEQLKVMPYRLRYTIGTRAAREGFGKLIIAELLDHEDTQNAHVYVENIPEYARRINEKIGHLMAPYAKAFAGVLVDSEDEAIRGKDKLSRIRLNQDANIGTCGSYDYCGANVPVPCYACAHFQPWLDAPHQEVLDRLVEERERIVELTEDLAVASANDRIIIAVAEVIQRCEKRKQELARD